jgi:SAM-dependent methyltransferase
MQTLSELYLANHADRNFRRASDKGTIHTYIPVYETLFEAIRDQARNVLEVGIASGHSLLLWEEYFPNATIYGVDIEPAPTILTGHERIRTIQHSSTDAALVPLLGGTQFDVVIDDGCHLLNFQLDTLKVLFSCVKPGGLYVVEDVGSDRGVPEFEKYGPVTVAGSRRGNDRLVIIRKV